MVIAVISDTHRTSLDDSFVRRVEELAQEVDHFFHLGDAVSPEILAFLNSFPLTAVAGNMDYPGIRSSWPVKTTVELDGLPFRADPRLGRPGGAGGQDPQGDARAGLPLLRPHPQTL